MISTLLDRPNIWITFYSLRHDIRHIKGSDNPVADALSRVNIGALLPNIPSVVDLGKIADAQHNDPELVRWLSSASSLLHLKPMPLPQSDKTIICD